MMKNMIHPLTELRYIGPQVGYGVFASTFIPKGTITYVEDELEVRIPEAQFFNFQPAIREILDKYSYIDAEGVRILSWDFAKYVNHRCDFNTISTGYGFEIAVRDIQAGEEITDEYGIFNMEKSMDCYCGSENCRKRVTMDDFDQYYPVWDSRIQEVLPLVRQVEQPLWSLVDPVLAEKVLEYLNDHQQYQSVFAFRRRRETEL